jgi:hypothetical protein
MLVKKIKEYLNTGKSVYDLYNETWIATATTYRILKRSWCKYNKNTLNILYDFFKIPHDDFYMQNSKKWFSKTPSLLGTMIRYKRIEKWLDLAQVSKKIKVDSRQLARIEAGDSLPRFNSYTFTQLFQLLEFTEQEKKLVEVYIKITLDLEKIVKNYELKDKDIV